MFIGMTFPESDLMISMADFTPSAPLSISMSESFIGLPPSEEANIASSSIFEEIILKKFSRTSILLIWLKSKPFFREFFFANSKIFSISFEF